MENLKYPTGPYQPASSYTTEEVKKWIEQIKTLPEKLVPVVASLSEEQLDTPYRPGGWTVRQLIHHLADSHMNSYIRMKWALSEDNTTIKAYDQEKWAEFPDSEAPVSISLELISALHLRWGWFLDRLADDDFERTYHHPENGEQTIWGHIDHYAWHGNHHLAHITSLIERKNWH